MRHFGIISAKFVLLASLIFLGLVASVQAGGGPPGGNVLAIAIDPIRPF